MFLVVRRRTLVFAALITVAAVISSALLLAPHAAVQTLAEAEGPSRVFVIDAGHGGEDGGAVSADGVPEKDLNLAIAQKLNALLQFLGEDTRMVRESDISVYSDGAETLRQKKVSDLKNRVALVNETPGAVLVSIHQNSLPNVRSVHGAQAFFGAVEPSAAIAQSVQRTLNETVNPENEKNAAAIGDKVYLMKHAQRPAVLIECGFLSNAEETALLLQDAYQTRLALAIAAGLLNTEEKEA